MIDESKQENAALFALGLLGGDEAAQIRVEIQSDLELRKLVDDFEAGGAALVHALPITKAPPDLLPRVLASVRGERPAVLPRATRGSRPPILPWVLAGCFAFAASALFFSMTALRVQNEQLRDAQESLLAEKLATEAEQQRLLAEREALEKQVATLESRNALAQIRIATLNSQLAAYAKVVAVAVWDAEKQQGLVKLDGLPKLAPDKDYQLWVIDPTGPVSAGVVTMDAGGAARALFKPNRPITSADKFAVSLERKGGSTAGPATVVLISN